MSMVLVVAGAVTGPKLCTGIDRLSASLNVAVSLADSSSNVAHHTSPHCGAKDVGSEVGFSLASALG